MCGVSVGFFSHTTNSRLDDFHCECRLVCFLWCLLRTQSSSFFCLSQPAARTVASYLLTHSVCVRVSVCVRKREIGRVLRSLQTGCVANKNMKMWTVQMQIFMIKIIHLAAIRFLRQNHRNTTLWKSCDSSVNSGASCLLLPRMNAVAPAGSGMKPDRWRRLSTSC